MNEQLATLIVASALRAARELGDIAPLLEAEDEALKLAVASAIYDIMENIAEPVITARPQLKADIEARIGRYGRAF